MSGPSTSWRRPFFVLWIGQSASLLGSALVQFALIWWLTRQTGRASTLALASIMGLIPFVVLGPFAGVLVDRWSRKRVLIIADASVALSTICLGVLFRLGMAEPWHVFVILFVRSIGGAFHAPAIGATTPLMVPPEQLTRVAGMNHSVRGLIQFAAPVLGAMLISIFPTEAVLMIDVATATIAIAAVAIIPIPRPKQVERPADASSIIGRVFSELAEGFRFTWNARGIRHLVLTSMIWGVVATPAPTFLPLLVTERFARGVEELGLIQALLAAGIVAGGLLLTAWGGFRNRLYTSLTGTVGLAIGGAFLGAAPVHLFGMVVVGITIVGISLAVHSGPIGAIYQGAIPNELQGRFFSLSRAIFSVLGPISLAVAGPLADVFGVRMFYIIHPIGALVIVGLRYSSRSVRALGELSEGTEAAKLASVHAGD